MKTQYKIPVMIISQIFYFCKLVSFRFLTGIQYFSVLSPQQDPIYDYLALLKII